MIISRLFHDYFIFLSPLSISTVADRPLLMPKISSLHGINYLPPVNKKQLMQALYLILRYQYSQHISLKAD